MGSPISKADYVRMRADQDGDGAIEGGKEKQLAKSAEREFDELDVTKDGVLDQRDAQALDREDLDGPSFRRKQDALTGLSALSQSGPHSQVLIDIRPADGGQGPATINDGFLRASAAELVPAFEAALAPEVKKTVTAKHVRGVYDVDLAAVESIQGTFRLSFDLPLTTLHDDPAVARAYARKLKGITAVNPEGEAQSTPVQYKVSGRTIAIGIDEANRNLWRTSLMELRFAFTDGTSAVRQVTMPAQARIDSSDIYRWELAGAAARYQDDLKRHKEQLAQAKASPTPNQAEIELAERLVKQDEENLQRNDKALRYVDAHAKARRQDF